MSLATPNERNGFSRGSVDWTPYGECKLDTGYDTVILDYVWHWYCGPGTYIRRPVDLYRALSYVHLYPRARQAKRFLNCSPSHLTKKVLKHLHWLATQLREIEWEERMCEMNHCPAFPHFVTGIVDCFPVHVVNPRSRVLFRALNNPKYGGPVYKVQLVVDFLGRIVLCTGPHLGIVPDNIIWRSTRTSHVMRPWEFLLADGAYIAEPELLTPWKLPNGGHLALQQYVDNAIISHYRARVEHINAVFESHNCFQYKFRGGLDLLKDCIAVTSNILNIQAHLRLRYEPVGPWAHFPFDEPVAS